MSFVFSPWYFVMIALVAGIVACLLVFFKMDRHDKVLIEKFLNESQNQEAEVTTENSIKEETKTE